MPKKPKSRTVRRSNAALSAAQRAVSNLLAGKTETALAWARSVREDGDDLQDTWVAGNIFAKCGELDQAITFFKRLRTVQPTNPDVALMLACCYASRGEADIALQALDSSSLSVDELRQFATALSSGGNHSHAIRILQDAQQRFPNNPHVDIELADYHFQFGYPRTAIEQLQACLSRSWHDPPLRARAWFNLAVLLSTNSPAEADDTTDTAVEEAYRKAIECDASYSKSWINLSVLLINEHRYDEAIDLLTTATEKSPDVPKLGYLLAFTLRLCDQFEQAISILKRLVARSTDDGSWELLGRCLSEAGRGDEAIQHYQRWLSVKPQHPVAVHLLSSIAGETIPARATAEYIANAFDTFAETFESTLAKLQYRGPAYIRQLLIKHLGEQPSDTTKPVRRALDAGCGTGLVGGILKQYAEELIGIDLSPAMLKQAAAKQVYDQLICGDLEEHLRQAPAQYDLIVAADTFNYFGDLSQLLPRCLAALTTNGWLIFTLEEGPLTEDQYFLQPHGRFVHSPAYIIERLGECGLAGGTMTRAVLRKEGDNDVYALLLAVQRPHAPSA